MENKKLAKTIIILCILLIISTSLGLYRCLIGNDFMSSNTLLYFTVQSNILILIVSIIYLIKFIVGYHECKIFNILHLIGTVSITLTFVVFTLLLTPEILHNGNIGFLTTISNITLHLITPVLAIIIFIISPDKNYKNLEPFYGLIYPIIYLIQCIIIDNFIDKPLYTFFDGTTSYFPYFFMDYHKNGFFTLSTNFENLGTFYLCTIVALFTFGICYVLIKLNKKKH